MEKPTAFIRKIATFLLNFYADNVKAIGMYGFVVVANIKKIKVRNLKMQIGSYTMNKRVAIDDTVSNVGDADIYLY